jgi:hypothetical protein
VCLNVTYSKVLIGKHLSNTFPIQNGLKQDVLSPSLFSFSLEDMLRKVQENQVGLKLNGTHQLLVFADDLSLLGVNLHSIMKNTETLIDTINKVDLEVKAEKTNHMLLSHHQKTGQYHDIKVGNRSLKMWHSSNIWKRP